MTTFTGTSAIALTWNAAGQCRGVYLERVRDRCRLRRWWEGRKANDRSVAETLAEGLRTLAPGSGTVVLAGGDDIASGFIDLEMPVLRPDELRSALTFELRRCAPVPDESLVWAYRQRPAPSGQRLAVRLYYVRQALWERWMADLGGLSHALDLVIPPPAALDPVLAGVPVMFGSDADARLLLAPRDDGRRDVQVLPESASTAGVFGAGPSPLDSPMLIADELANQPAATQAAFTAPLVLAMYGLSRSFAADRRTGFGLPYELRSRRHRQSRLVAASLAVYTALVGLYGVARFYADRERQYVAVRADRVQMESQIEDVGQRLDQDQAKLVEQLEKEIAELSQPRPSMAVAMAEITRRVGRAGWCTSYRWSEGAIGIQLRESQKIEDLERTLEQSPLLGDVRQEYIKVQNGVIDRKVEMNARYDIGNERSAPPPSEALPKDADEGADEASDGVDGMGEPVPQLLPPPITGADGAVPRLPMPAVPGPRPQIPGTAVLPPPPPP